MNTFYAYTRVSTLKQGEKGVSLQEQHAAIARYAERQGLQISEWIEERLTAAKQGRPLFAKMMKGLRSGKARGVIIHKIDRGARNLRDWSDIGELIDAGVSVHFANESLDLHSRGGRLSADIQAVVAADYVRNLREETRKGLYGRLKQGIYPFQAPLGYLDTGSGKVKAVDPMRGPIVRQAFALYASGNYTLDSLLVELHARGLTNRNGRSVSKNGISEVLNNPFYAGLIRIRKTGETFPGGHAPLISMNLWKGVQARLSGRFRAKGWIHDFTLRGLFHCSLCRHPLIGERQKGNVYYRCHTKSCPTKSFREEVLEAAMLSSWPSLAPTPEWRETLRRHLEYVVAQDGETDLDRRSHVQAQVGAISARLNRLIDAMVDGALDKVSFAERKQALLEEKAVLEHSLEQQKADPVAVTNTIMEALELASSAQLSYRLGSPEIRRELAIRLCSNRSVAEKDASVEPSFPLSVLAIRDLVTCGGHLRYATRTLKRCAQQLYEWGKEEVERQKQECDGYEDPSLTKEELTRLRRFRRLRSLPKAA